MPRHHLNYFDFDSMKRILTRLGFKVKELMGTFPMEFFLLSGDNYISNSKLGRKCHSRRKTFEMNMYKKDTDLLNSIYRTLGDQGIGRELVIIARID